MGEERRRRKGKGGKTESKVLSVSTNPFRKGFVQRGTSSSSDDDDDETFDDGNNSVDY